MKRIITFVLAGLILATFTSCGKTVECDFCSEEVNERKAHKSEVFGETMHTCQECYDELVETFQ